MKRLVLAAVLPVLTLGASFGPAAADDLASLTITVQGVSAKGGDLRVGLYDAQSFAVRGAKPVNGAVKPAVAGTMVVTLEGIVPGSYGVKVLEDQNANGKMDLRLGMFPTEPYGFSNDPVIKMGPPSWDEVKLVVKPGGNAITIHMK